MMPVFLHPWFLLALAALPAIWWLLRAMPPQPQRIEFPATRILKGLKADEETPNHTPWWLTLIRMLAAALVVLAFAEPVLNPQAALVMTPGPLVLVIDNGWAAAAHWDQRQDEALRLIGEAETTSRPVVIVPTAYDPRAVPPRLMTAKEARDSLAALAPQPIALSRREAAAKLETVLAGQTDVNLFWLADGIAADGDQDFAAKLAALAGAAGHLTMVEASAGAEPLGLVSKLGEGGGLEFQVLRTGGPLRSLGIEALSGAGLPLAEAKVDLGAGSADAAGRIEVPLELRNQIARLAIRSEASAGAVQLLDSNTRWNRIGLVTGAARETEQPLLGQLYYVERAMRPYAELAIPDDNDSATAVTKLVAGNVSVLVLADVGKIAGPARETVDRFLTHGGVIVRFAGPRLEEGGDDLLPVDLRSGERSLGGALSWSTPQPLASFEPDSPFAGLAVPSDVRITRQVLADPALLYERTHIWARLADGTPLVTAEKRGSGWIVLFHVTANADWSNLPLSGLFVDMLRRITRLTGRTELAGSVSSSAPAGNLLTPLETLDAYGALGAPPPSAEPLARDAPAGQPPDATHPPGLYGGNGANRALNVLAPGVALKPIAGLPAGVTSLAYRGIEAKALKPLALSIALGLLLADMLAVLVLQFGGLFGRRARAGALGVLVACGALAAGALCPVRADAAGHPSAHAATASAESDNFALKAALSTRLAYVVTGDKDADETSRQGLTGLDLVLTQRTAVEPGEPMAVDVDKDELAFFPILYWPVVKDAKALSEATRARVAAYMKNGGLIIFDTRDEGDRVPGLETGAGNPALQRLVQGLDIPRLEPVPQGHVLTKSFYLLRGFPGRYDSSPMWVEVGGGAQTDPAAADSPQAQASRQSDGVSAVIVTGNDLAGAWAADDNGTGLYAVVPGGDEQREMAYRVGVNIVMYALTGNYKADQVHVTTILERLGQ